MLGFLKSADQSPEITSQALIRFVKLNARLVRARELNAWRVVNAFAEN